MALWQQKGTLLQRSKQMRNWLHELQLVFPKEMSHASSEGMRNEACCYLWTFGYITGTEWSQKHKMQHSVMHLGCFVFKCRWLLWRVDTYTLSWNIMSFHYFGSMSNHQANPVLPWEADTWSLYQFKVHRNNSNLGLTVNKLQSQLLYSMTCFRKPEYWVNIAQRQTCFGSGGNMHSDRQCVITGSVNAWGLN